MTNLKRTSYVDKELLDTMKEFFQKKRNLIIAHNFIRLCHRLVVYKQAYDISQEDLTMPASHTRAQYTIQVAFSEKYIIDIVFL